MLTYSNTTIQLVDFLHYFHYLKKPIPLYGSNIHLSTDDFVLFNFLLLELKLTWVGPAHYKRAQ